MRQLMMLSMATWALTVSGGTQAKTLAPGAPERFCSNIETTDVRERFSDCNPIQRRMPEVAAAISAAKQATQQCLDLINAGTSEKRVKWNSDAAKRCIDAYMLHLRPGKRAKPDLDKARAACAEALQGLRTKGQSCDSSVECESGLGCIGATGGPPGICKKPLAKGQACDDSALTGGVFFTLLNASKSVCATGLRCGVANANLVCLPASGDTGSAGTACGGTAECQKGHLCEAGRCVRKCG